MTTYWFGDRLAPLSGYERFYCGGRHGGAFERDERNMVVVGGRRHHRDRANAVQVKCRYCGDRLRGTSAGIEAEQREPQPPKSYKRRDERLSRKEGNRGGHTTIRGGVERRQMGDRDTPPPPTRAQKITQKKRKREGVVTKTTGQYDDVQKRHWWFGERAR